MNSDTVNILAVDDRSENLVVLRSILESLEQNIVVAHSGEEALRRVLEQDFAVILLDVNMPDLDGLETAALIRERKKSANTPIIFITAYADEVHVTQGYSLGAVDYIFSPVVPEILQAKVRVFVELSRMTQQVKQQAEQRVALAREQAARATAEESNRRASFIAQASRALASSLDLDATVSTITRVMVPSLADLCGLTLIDEAEKVQQTKLAWIDDENRSDPHSVTIDSISHPSLARAIEKVIESRKADRLTDLKLEDPSPSDVTGGSNSDPLRHLYSAAIFPLPARGRILGVLFLGINASRSAITDSALALAEDLAERMALALDKALLYQELRDSDRRKSEFLAMLGHELRNPLTPIHNAVEILNVAGTDAGKLTWAKGVIKRQVKQLTRLVDDLLDISRMTQGKIQLKLAPVDVAEVMEAAVETTRPLIESRKHELIVSAPPEPVLINADCARVAQILSNLLNNAAKFTREGGRISLSATRADDEVVFRVSDTGVGLAAGNMSTIFDLFTQGEVPDSSERGLGIGLTLVRRLAEIHGGTVRAYSPGVNQGSEFSVSLPLLAKEQTSSIDQQERKPPQKIEQAPSLRVMVVDDNVDIAETTGELLRLAGYEVELAYEGITALKSVLTFKPDIVLLDLGMPGMDGYEVARRVRAESNGYQPILVAVSGYGQEEYIRRAKEVGFDRCVVKPVDGSKLATLLAALYSAKVRATISRRDATDN
jgi:signal transduction histidine kinase/DNA-binding response OmpR family regulator